MVVLMTLCGRQRRPRMKRKWCPRHMPRGRYGKLPQGDLFMGVPQFPCTCLRLKAREWWLVKSKSVVKAREVCLAWPSTNGAGKVLAHGKGEVHG